MMVWRSFRLKNVVSLVVHSAAEEDDLPYVGLEAIEPWTGKINLDVKEADEETSVGNRFLPGDVLFGKLRPYLAKVAAPSFSGQCTGEALVLRPKSGVNTRFIRYRLVEAGFIDSVNASTFGAKMPRASWQFLGNLRFPLPDPDTQQVISDYLDHETALIDQLIEKKQRFLELSSDLLAAQIAGVFNTHSQNFPVWKLSHVCSLRRGRFNFRPRNAPELYDGPYPFLQTGDVAQASKYITTHKQTLSEIGKDVSSLFPAGCVLMAIAANVGDVAISTFDAYCPDSVVGFFPSRAMDIEYLYYSLKSVRALISNASTSNAQDNTNLARLSSLRIPIPDLDIQRHCAVTLGGIEEKQRKERNLVNCSIEKLFEFRSALITAAVTGQIDVTTWSKQGETDRRLDKIQEEMGA